METFVLLGKYSVEAIKTISADRTKNAVALIEKLGGKIESMHAMLGPHDLLLIVRLPGIREAMQASIALGKATGIAFTTAPAVSVEDFDKLTAQG